MSRTQDGASSMLLTVKCVLMAYNPIIEIFKSDIMEKSQFVEKSWYVWILWIRLENEFSGKNECNCVLGEVTTY